MEKAPVLSSDLEIPGYELLTEIGHGAYGTVWLARDVVGLYRAVKIVRRSRFEDVRPYEREFGGIKRFTPISLEHDGLVRVFHVGRDDSAGFFHYVMEAADDERHGPTMDPRHYLPHTLAGDVSRHGHLSANEVAQVGIALGEAIEFLHQRRLVHRDIKPANVLYVRGRPKLGDIGLLTDMAATDRDVSFLGTKGYLAPEGPGTAAADVFSLGKLLYVAATGRAPETYPELPAEVAARADREGIGSLEGIWQRACHADPARRYPSALAMVHDLKEAFPNNAC
jgi:serine/threonine protein kinase